MTTKELKEMRTWLVWKKQERDGKIAKVPFSAGGKACGTSEKYKEAWVTYAEAIQAAKVQHMDGVGFRIPRGVFFLDIDHKDLDDPMVKKLVTQFDTYTEYSVSGTGIHIYGLCDITSLDEVIKDKTGKWKLSKEFYTHHPDNGLELYIGELTNRFSVFTGNVIAEKPLRDCTEEIHAVLSEYMRREQLKAKPAAETVDTVDIDKKAEKMVSLLKKEHKRFKKIFEEGYPDDGRSHSEYDIAICSVIAYHTGDDPELIDAVFRKSALYREKWEREDYRKLTIEKAIEGSARLKARRAQKPPFVKTDEKGRQTVSAPLLAKYTRENLHYLQVRDKGNQAALIYVYEDGVYKLYDHNMLYGVIKKFISYYNEELVKMSTVKDAAQLILSDLTYTPQDILNSDESIINFQNGLLKISGDSIALIAHSPEVLSTIQIPCRWSKEPKPTPVFDNYLSTLSNGDEAIKQLLLEFMGVCISNISGWRMKKSLFLVGEGNTGKSQLKSLTERLLGKGSYIGIDLSEIEARFGTGAIYGTRLAGSSDMSFLSVDELKTFKKITGGDSLFAEFKGQQPFEYVYNGLLWFCMNKLPRFSGDMGQWVYDRIMVVQCDNVIPPEKQDKQLLDTELFRKMMGSKETV